MNDRMRKLLGEGNKLGSACSKLELRHGKTPSIAEFCSRVAIWRKELDSKSKAFFPPSDSEINVMNQELELMNNQFRVVSMTAEKEANQRAIDKAEKAISSQKSGDLENAAKDLSERRSVTLIESEAAPVVAKKEEGQKKIKIAAIAATVAVVGLAVLRRFLGL